MKRSFSLQELHSAISEQESCSKAAMESHADVLSLGFAGATLSTMRRSKSMNALENQADPESSSSAGDLMLPSLASLVRRRTDPLLCVGSLCMLQGLQFALANLASVQEHVSLFVVREKMCLACSMLTMMPPKALCLLRLVLTWDTT
jgi:hypothetical protein